MHRFVSHFWGVRNVLFTYVSTLISHVVFDYTVGKKPRERHVILRYSLSLSLSLSEFITQRLEMRQSFARHGARVLSNQMFILWKASQLCPSLTRESCPI